VFAEFKRQYPNVAVNVKRSEHQRILEALIDNSCDFGVVSMPVKDKRYTVVTIHRDELVVITPTKHPLAGRGEVSLAEVAQYPLLLPKLGRTRDALEALFHERRLKPIISMELDSSELTKRFVAADVGISFISRSNVAEDLKARTLSALKMSDAVLRRDLALIFRTDKALSRAALAFIDIAVKLKTGAAPTVMARTP
jgi:DNA-binding transcriptional LysR family regulator